MASPIRKKKLNGGPEVVAPPSRCAKNVTTPMTIESTKNGSFSANNSMTILDTDLSRLRAAKRFNGQKSISNKTSGTVTSIGFDSNPKTKNPSESL